MNVMHLCCGRGGSLWTGAILGWRNIWAVDNDRWRIECLRREAAAGWWPELNTICADISDASWHAGINDRVDCIAAGFSCRDISAAGTGAGIDGKSTGPTYRGCIEAVESFRPSWVFFENSPHIRTKGRTRVTSDLVTLGYRWRDGVIAASDVGAPHIRKRWFLLAVRSDIDCVRKLQLERGGQIQRGWVGDVVQDNSADADTERRDRGTWSQWQIGRTQPADGDKDIAHSLRYRPQEPIQSPGLSKAGLAAIQAAAGYCGAYDWNPIDSGLLRVVDGVADRRKRVAALGDAWVPLQAAAAWCLLGGPT